MTNPNAYLRLAFRQWQMTRRVPGTKKRLIVNLGTGDIVEARRLRDQVWGEFIKQQKSDEQLASELAAELAAGNVDGVEHAVMALEDGWEEKHGLQEAKRLVRIALGKQTPITAYLDAFVRERPCAVTTRLARLTSIRSLPFNFVQDVNTKNAGHYISELARRKNANTVNSRISHLRGYWDFLKSKGIAKENPWIGQTVKRDRRSKPGSGVWTFAEVGRMLTQCRSELQLVMRVLVYSGCRCGELALLRPEHMNSEGFHIPVAKTAAGERLVYLPKSIMMALGKQTGQQYVFLPTISAKGARGRPGAFSKVLSAELRRLFPEYDTSLQRNSLKTTHGLRKLWVTVAEQEGVPLHLIQAACGHQRSGVTLSVYSAGPSQSQIRDVFAKVAQRIDDELISGGGEGGSEEARGLSP